jgi:hypothetical protein
VDHIEPTERSEEGETGKARAAKAKAEAEAAQNMGGVGHRPTLIVSGIWGFASGAGAMGILHGVFSLLGGAAMIGTVVGALAGAFGGQDDIAIALAFAGPGCVLIGAIFLAIAMFGRLRQPA